MSNELLKGKIVLDQKMGKESTQVLVEGDIIVPDIKPDMSVVLQTNAKVTIDKTEISADRINYSGKIIISVLYLAKGNEKPVHNLSVTAPFEDFLNMEGVTREMWVESKCETANLDFKMLNDRKLNYRAVVDVHFEATVTEEHQVVTNIEGIPENQLQKCSLKLNRSIENKEDQFIVKDEIAVPSGKPNIREILQCNISITNRDVRVGNGKVTINGELVVTTLYKGDEDSSLIEFMEHEVTFNGAVELSEAKEDMFADIVLYVKDQYIQVRPDSDGEERVIEIEVCVGAIAKVHIQDSIEILEDAYCINQKLIISKTPIKYSKLICRNKNQSPIKEVVLIDDHCPDMLQIFRVTGSTAVDNIKVIDDKVIAEGIINTDILYVAENDETPLYSYKSVIPYRQVIETKGSNQFSEVLLDTSIDHISFNMLSGREVEVRFLLSLSTQVSEEKEMSMITDIEFCEMSKQELDQVASMTIYVIQKGDTLWKIAKMYNTSIDEILKINDIEDADKIYQGQKLLILKKVC